MIAPRFLASFSSVNIRSISALRFSLSPGVLPSIAVSTTPSAATTTAATATTTAASASATTVTGVTMPLSPSVDAAPCTASGPTPTIPARP
eukprot:7382132-Prymnesium_polylepis.1